MRPCIQEMNEDEVLNCNSTGCAVTASDPDGQWDTLTLSILNQAISGVATVVGDGTALEYTYTPDVNFVGRGLHLSTFQLNGSTFMYYRCQLFGLK